MNLQSINKKKQAIDFIIYSYNHNAVKLENNYSHITIALYKFYDSLLKKRSILVYN